MDFHERVICDHKEIWDVYTVYSVFFPQFIENNSELICKQGLICKHQSLDLEPQAAKLPSIHCSLDIPILILKQVRGATIKCHLDEMSKNSLYSALTSSYDIFHKRSPPVSLADLFSVSALVKVINCAHMAIVNTKMIILPRNWAGGQVTMTKAKDMLYVCAMIKEHCIILNRASVWCCMK